MKRNSARPSATSAVADRSGVAPRGGAPPAPGPPRPPSVGVVDQRPIHFSPTAKGITVAVLAGAAVFFLFGVRGILTPFIWAVVVAYAFNPLVDWLVVRLGIRRIWCVALPYLL